MEGSSTHTHTHTHEHTRTHAHTHTNTHDLSFTIYWNGQMYEMKLNFYQSKTFPMVYYTANLITFIRHTYMPAL